MKSTGPRNELERAFEIKEICVIMMMVPGGAWKYWGTTILYTKRQICK